MTDKKIWLGLLLIVLVFGMTVVSCDNGSTSSSGPKKITINGLSGRNGNTILLVVYTSPDGSGMDAAGRETVSGSSVTISLSDNSYNPWTKTGEYYLMLRDEELYDGDYIYTDGKTFAELGINGPGDNYKLPKYNITGAASTIGFAKFTRP